MLILDEATKNLIQKYAKKQEKEKNVKSLNANEEYLAEFYRFPKMNDYLKSLKKGKGKAIKMCDLLSAKVTKDYILTTFPYYLPSSSIDGVAGLKNDKRMFSK